MKKSHSLKTALTKSLLYIATLFTLVLTLSTPSSISAKTAWFNPMDAPYFVVQNQAWPQEIGHTYVRLPDRARPELRQPLWDLSRNASGLALQFDTDAPVITVRYVVSGDHAMPHMPATGVTGVDLYRTGADGRQLYCYGTYSFGDTIVYNYPNLTPGHYDYRLNLPLYNTVEWMEIGVPEGHLVTFKERSQEKPVVVYGTSITQGACSSRPGMSWSNILCRQLGIPVYNYGFSGNGRLEPAMIDLIGEIDAAAYVLDCLPNLIGLEAGTVNRLVLNAVRTLRSQSDAPIVLVEHCGYSNAATRDGQFQLSETCNVEQRAAYDQLIKEGIAGLYYITREELGYPDDAWVDYIHPTDLGAQRHADVLTPRIRAIISRH